MKSAAIAAALAAGYAAAQAPPRPPAPASAHTSPPPPRDLLDQCDERWATQYLDHFSFAGKGETYEQRYFVCADSWQPGGPLFFYTGNEADVTLYLNNTGLMWDNADAFGAALVFAEHRFFGESQPADADDLRHLSSEQALADYATLLHALRAEFAPSTGAVAFGGSYGGMLASWLRIKYPWAVDGAVAASAPILSFVGEQPAMDPYGFARVETEAFVDSASGAGAACQAAVRDAWTHIFSLGESAAGLAQIGASMGLCAAPADLDEAYAVAYWAQSGLDYLAMGNYPYASSYIVNGEGELPAWPFRLACDAVAAAGDELAGLAAAVSIFYNATGEAECLDFTGGANNATSRDGELWNWMFCSEMLQPFGRNGESDMFFAQPWDLNQTAAGCVRKFGVEPRPEWPTVLYGGRSLAAASNIVWSNGALDPWSADGVLNASCAGCAAIVIDGAAHHLDLFFASEEDPAAVVEAREEEMGYVRGWLGL